MAGKKEKDKRLRGVELEIRGRPEAGRLGADRKEVTAVWWGGRSCAVAGGRVGSPPVGESKVTAVRKGRSLQGGRGTIKGRDGRTRREEGERRGSGSSTPQQFGCWPEGCPQPPRGDTAARLALL